MTYSHKGIMVSQNEAKVEFEKYDIRFVSGVHNPGHEMAKFYSFCQFQSMEHLLHYFNLMAMPENQPYAVPEFNLNLIQCINWSDYSIIFRNRQGFESFISVVDAEVTAED